MRVITKTDWNCKWIHVYDYTLNDIRELQKQGGGYLVHIVCFAHYGNTLMKINSRNGHIARPVRFAPYS